MQCWLILKYTLFEKYFSMESFNARSILFNLSLFSSKVINSHPFIINVFVYILFLVMVIFLINYKVSSTQIEEFLFYRFLIML